MNLAKFLRTPFLTEHARRLSLNFMVFKFVETHCFCGVFCIAIALALLIHYYFVIKVFLHKLGINSKIWWPRRANLNFEKKQQNLNCEIKQNLSYEIKQNLTFERKRNRSYEINRISLLEKKQNLSFKIKRNLNFEIK